MFEHTTKIYIDKKLYKKILRFFSQYYQLLCHDHILNFRELWTSNLLKWVQVVASIQTTQNS